MPSQFKYVATRGQRSPDIVAQAGLALGTDTIAVSFNTAKMSKRDAIELVDQVKRNIQEGLWPPL